MIGSFTEKEEKGTECS